MKTYVVNVPDVGPYVIMVRPDGSIGDENSASENVRPLFPGTEVIGDRFAESRKWEEGDQEDDESEEVDEEDERILQIKKLMDEQRKKIEKERKRQLKEEQENIKKEIEKNISKDVKRRLEFVPYKNLLFFENK